jgi:hypothetical protein
MYSSVFISYGGPDESFARRINAALIAVGVKTWFFKHDALPGQKLHEVMRRGVQEHDRVLLICSKNSLARPGVTNEIEKVLEREAREGGSAILIPITIDDYLFNGWWPTDVREATLKQEITNRVVADYRNAEASPIEFENAMARVVNSVLIRP